MTQEQFEIIEASTKNLRKETWWDCRGCPIITECDSTDDAPPCEKALFEAVEIAKGLCK